MRLWPRCSRRSAPAPKATTKVYKPHVYATVPCTGQPRFLCRAWGWEELVAVAQRSQDADNPRNCLAKQNDPVTIQYGPCIRKAAGRAAFLLRKNVQFFVSFDEAHYTNKSRPFSQIAQIAARADTSPYPATKICTFATAHFHQAGPKNLVANSSINLTVHWCIVLIDPATLS